MIPEPSRRITLAEGGNPRSDCPNTCWQAAPPERLRTLSCRAPFRMNTDSPVLSLKGVAKSFAGVTVLRDIDFTVRGGEVHALVGENGAGKSTLIKIIGGVYQPSAGRMLYKGQHTSFAGPNDAQRRGICVVHQDFSTVPDLSVAENLFLGIEPRNPLGFISWRQLRRGARALLDDLS